MHQYTKHLYVKLSSNFEILKVKIDTQALYDNTKRGFTQWDYKKTISFVFKIELSYEITNLYLESSCLMIGLKICGMHLYTMRINFSRHISQSNIIELTFL